MAGCSLAPDLVLWLALCLFKTATFEGDTQATVLKSGTCSTKKGKNKNKNNC